MAWHRNPTLFNLVIWKGREERPRSCIRPIIRSPLNPCYARTTGKSPIQGIRTPLRMTFKVLMVNRLAKAKMPRVQS